MEGRCGIVDGTFAEGRCDEIDGTTEEGGCKITDGTFVEGRCDEIDGAVEEGRCNMIDGTMLAGQCGSHTVACSTAAKQGVSDGNTTELPEWLRCPVLPSTLGSRGQGVVDDERLPTHSRKRGV